MRKGRRRRIPDGTAVFQNKVDKGDVESNKSWRRVRRGIRGQGLYLICCSQKRCEETTKERKRG